MSKRQYANDAEHADAAVNARLISLVATMETVTAIANDISYDDVFVYQLRTLARPGDLLVSYSASGDSENVVRAVDWAAANAVDSLAITGFAGPRSRPSVARRG